MDRHVLPSVRPSSISRLAVVLLATVGCRPTLPPPDPRPVTPDASPREDPPDGPRRLVAPEVRFGHPQFPSDINRWAWLPDGEHLAAAYGDGTVRVWDLDAGTSTTPLAVHSPAPIEHLCVSANGLVTADDRGRLRRTSLDGLATTAELDRSWCGAGADAKCGIRSVSCSPKSDLLVIRTRDERVSIVPSIERPESPRVLESVADAVLAPDGSALALVRSTDDGSEFSLLREPLIPGAVEVSLPCAFRDSYWPQMVFSPDSKTLALSHRESALPSQVCLWTTRRKRPTLRSLKVEERARATAASEDEESMSTAQVVARFDSDSRLSADLTIGWSGEGFYPEYRDTITWDTRSAKVVERRPFGGDSRVEPVRTEGPVLIVERPGAGRKSLPPWTEDDRRLTAPITAIDVASDGRHVHLLRGATALMTHDADGGVAGTTIVKWFSLGLPHAIAVSDDSARLLVGYANILPEENEECGEPHDGAPGGLLRVDLDDGTRTELAKADLGFHVPLAFLPGTHIALSCDEDYSDPDYFFECGSAFGPGPVGTMTRMDLDAGTSERLPVKVDVCPDRGALGLAGQRVALLRAPADRDVEDWGEAAYDEDPYFDVEVVSWATGASAFRTPKSLAVVDHALSDDGHRLAIATHESVQLIDVDHGAVQWRHPLESTTEPSSLAVSPDGRMVVIGFKDGTLRYWSEDEEGLSALPRVHTRAVLDLRFEPSGALHTVGDDHSAFRWPV